MVQPALTASPGPRTEQAFRPDTRARPAPVAAAPSPPPPDPEPRHRQQAGDGDPGHRLAHPGDRPVTAIDKEIASLSKAIGSVRPSPPDLRPALLSDPCLPPAPHRRATDLAQPHAHAERGRRQAH